MINSLLMFVRRFLVCFVGMLALVGCSSKKSADPIAGLGLPYEVKASYTATSTLLEEAPSTLKSYRITGADNDLQLLVDQYDGLVFNYTASELSDDARKFCAHHKYRVDSLRQVIRGVISENLASVRRTLVNENELQIEEETEFAFFVPKGTKIYVDYSVSSPANVRLYNKETHAALRSWGRKKEVNDSVVVKSDGVYVWKVKVKGAQYLTVDITKNLINIDELDKHYEVPDDVQ